MSHRSDDDRPSNPSPPSPAPASPIATRSGPSIYVACLASYNAGHLHGAWIEVEPDEVLTCARCDEEARSLRRLPAGERPAESQRLQPVCLAHARPELLARHRDSPAALEGVRALRANIEMEVLSTSPVPEAEEWAIHDIDNWHGLSVGEHEALSDVVAKALLVIEHGALGVALARHLGADHDPDLLHQVWTWMDEQYDGAFDSPQDWAGTWLDETGVLNEVPVALRPYVDFEAYARDAELSGDIVMLRLEGDEADGRVHVFRNA